MATKKTIAILNSNNEKSEAVLQQLNSNNYRLLLFSKDILTTTTGEIESIHCPIEASWEADLVILAVKDSDIEPIAKAIQPVVTQKPVLYINEINTSIAELSALLPFSKVYPVKANQIESFIQSYHKL